MFNKEGGGWYLSCVCHCSFLFSSSSVLTFEVALHTLLVDVEVEYGFAFYITLPSLMVRRPGQKCFSPHTRPQNAMTAEES